MYNIKTVKKLGKRPAALLEVIKANPGIGVTKLAELTGCSRTTAYYRLAVLESLGCIKLARRENNRIIVSIDICEEL